MRSRALAAVALAVLVFSHGHSQQPRNPDLDRIRGDIRNLRERLEDVRRKAQSAQQEVEEAELELGIRTSELELAERVAADLDAQQHALRAQIGELAPRIERQRAYLRQRLVALYRLGGLSYLRLFLSIDGSKDPVEAISMLSYLVGRDARAVTRFQATQQELASRTAQLADRLRRLSETRRVIDERRRALVAAHAQKEKMLAALLRQESGSARQLAELEEKARRLERLLGVLSKQGGAAPALDIRSVQGALAWPVAGPVIERFGRQRNAKFATVTMNNGIKIGAAPNTPVRAVFQGTVLFSQWFKGYGNLIILDHGNRVFSLYGNVKAPSIGVGDRIATGQTIAGVGESEEAASGYLYFEMRQDNRPEDPQKWLR